jgi:hypothetical protein
MPAELVAKSPEYILNLCTRFLARDNPDSRHSYFGTESEHARARISDAWRFPIVDAHEPGSLDEVESGTYAFFNDVTFVLKEPRDGPPFESVGLVTSAAALNQSIEMKRVGDSLYHAATLKVGRGQRHRYRFLVAGSSVLDPVNPQLFEHADGSLWSSFFTWEYQETVVLERWEFTLVDRLVRQILPFEDEQARIFLERGAADAQIPNLHRLDVSVGAANYIDKILAREERHHLQGYRACLDMIAEVLRRRFPGIAFERVPSDANRSPNDLKPAVGYNKLYEDMSAGNPWSALVADGWDLNRYDNPTYFVNLLRRHAWTGAFCHPKYGGNFGAMTWAYLADSYRVTDPALPEATAFDWQRAIERPYGRSNEYFG